MILCMGCMEKIEEQFEECPYCGYHVRSEQQSSPYLEPGTVLFNKYIVGKVLGSGGFGTTYIGWNYVLRQKVAIKEYLPRHLTLRELGCKDVQVNNPENVSRYEEGLQQFLDEAKFLARLNHIPGIVQIQNYFPENNTGYIVMEYLEGQDVKHLLADRGGVLPYDQAKSIILSVLYALRQVHSNGILHRDIAPDNVFITKAGIVKLLDFGAAKHQLMGSSQTEVILKKGYAPVEQYHLEWQQGSYTDMYAVGALFYRMVVGRPPFASVDRVEQDDLKPPIDLGIPIPESGELAIMTSLNVNKEYRIQTARDYMEALGAVDFVPITEEETTTTIAMPTEEIEKNVLFRKINNMSIKKKVLFASLTLISIVVVGLGIGFALRSDNELKIVDENKLQTMDNVEGIMEDEAIRKLKDLGISLVEITYEYNTDVQEGIVTLQSPSSGDKLDKDAKASLVISGGTSTLTMPDVTAMDSADAVQFLQENGFDPVRISVVEGTSEDYSDVIPMGCINRQSVTSGQKVQLASIDTVVLTKSLGSEKSVTVSATNMVSLTKKEIMELGLPVKFVEQYDDKVPKGKCISQDVQPGQSINILTGTPNFITVKISKGKQTIEIPKVIDMKGTEACEQIQSLGVNVRLKQEESDKVAKGNVISQSVVGKISKGTEVTLVVSKGESQKQSEPSEQDTTQDYDDEDASFFDDLKIE